MMDKIFVINGCSNHSDKQREDNDYYATHPSAVEELLKVEKFNTNIWEPCCGELHISNVLTNNGYNVRNSDLIVRNGLDIEQLDFMSCTDKWCGDIITNPPYKYAKDFVLKALDLLQDGNKLAMFLKVTFLEGQARYKQLFSKYPPKYVYIFSKRTICAMNGDFETYKTSAVAYAWYVWEKGYTDESILRWVNI